VGYLMGGKLQAGSFDGDLFGGRAK